MQSIKKTLLIFFGELRTFEYVIPHLNRLDEVDIVLSTWNGSFRFDTKFLVDEKLIYQILPSIKQCHIVNPNDIPNFDSKFSSWKMYWHWKNAINNIENPEQYEKVILHRTDLISNWETTLDIHIENDTLYCHHGSLTDPYFKKGINNHEIDGVWVNDYYFFGKLDIMKKFVNSLNNENYTLGHVGLWQSIIQNNIKFKQFILQGGLMRDSAIKELEEMKSTGATFKPFPLLTGPN
jgi:hypothetical protein